MNSTAKSWLKAITLTGLLLVGAQAAFADPLGGRIQIIERNAKELLLKMNPNYVFESAPQENPHGDIINPVPAPVNKPAVPLSWGQKMAADDMERLYKSAHELVLMIEDGEEDFNTLQPKLAQVQSAASQVKVSLPISNLEGDAQVISQGLLASVQELATVAKAEREAQEEKRKIAQDMRNRYYSGYSGYNAPGYFYSPFWSLNYGFGNRYGYNFGYGYGRGYRRGCR
jgi:hypothetical protein